jgi:phosphoribosylformimino-5-aminoimidazole carboxamide ribotide isomerase
MNLLPAIDLRGGKVVRLLQGDYDQQTTYGDDPLAQARAFEQAGASWLHIVDLDGARDGRQRHLDVVRSISSETSLKVEVGGGVRDERAIDALLNAGVERVIVGTAALKRWDWFESLMGNPTYRGRLVLGLDAKADRVAIAGWEETTQATPLEIAAKVRDWPLSAIVYTDIATDGTLEGPNVETTRAMCEATDVPIVASGGVGTLADLAVLRELPIQGAIVGKAIYENRFTIQQAVAVFEQGESVED